MEETSGPALRSHLRPARVPGPDRDGGRGRRHRGGSARTAPGRWLDKDRGLDSPNAYVKPRPQAMADPTELTLAEAAWMIRDRKISSLELVEAYLARIDAFETTYLAFNTVLADAAREAAKTIARRPHRGPLHGIPLAIKDNYYTEGVHTTANSFLFKDFVPPFDATAVAGLKAGGAIVLGKTQMGPLATTRATTPAGVITTVNAWAPSQPNVDPGGSSSGTATSVAGRMATSGTRHPDRRLHHRAVERAEPHRSQADHGPGLAVRDHPALLLPRPSRHARPGRQRRGDHAYRDGRRGPGDPRTQGLPKVPNLIDAATPVYTGNRLKLRWNTRIGVLPGYADGTSETAAARRKFLSTMAAIRGVTLVDVPFPTSGHLLAGNDFNNVRLPERSEPFMPYLRSDLRGFGVSVLGWLQGRCSARTKLVTGQRAKLLLLERVLDQVFDKCDCGGADVADAVRRHRPAGDRLPDRVHRGGHTHGDDPRRPAVRGGSSAVRRRRLPGGLRLALAPAGGPVNRRAAHDGGRAGPSQRRGGRRAVAVTNPARIDLRRPERSGAGIQRRAARHRACSRERGRSVGPGSSRQYRRFMRDRWSRSDLHPP